MPRQTAATQPFDSANSDYLISLKALDFEVPVFNLGLCSKFMENVLGNGNLS